MLAITNSATLQGVAAVPVTVEANGGEKGEPRCVLVGLPDTAVKESLDRILSSLANSGYSRPRTRVTINLAPGDLRKEGVAFDLPIALCILAASGQISEDCLPGFLNCRRVGTFRGNAPDKRWFIYGNACSEAEEKGSALTSVFS